MSLLVGDPLRFKKSRASLLPCESVLYRIGHLGKAGSTSRTAKITDRTVFIGESCSLTVGAFSSYS